MGPEREAAGRGGDKEEAGDPVDLGQWPLSCPLTQVWVFCAGFPVDNCNCESAEPSSNYWEEAAIC